VYIFKSVQNLAKTFFTLNISTKNCFTSKGGKGAGRERHKGPLNMPLIFLMDAAQFFDKKSKLLLTNIIDIDPPNNSTVFWTSSGKSAI